MYENYDEKINNIDTLGIRIVSTLTTPHVVSSLCKLFKKFTFTNMALWTQASI
jgi:hypothetical protein